ncbi:MAG: hypothetical protein EBZ77_10740 [Chitinophagia bacterium]|nr:hypothetical protein [Chitinophagia bacterium]
MDYTTPTLTGQATEQQIAEWKARSRYGIYSLEAGGHIGYFKNPDRHELNCAMSKADKDKALDMFAELAALTFLGGSDALLTDDQLFIGICQELKGKLEGKKATLVNL